MEMMASGCRSCGYDLSDNPSESVQQRFRSALMFGVFVQFVCFLLTALVLDGGQTHREYIFGMTSYWLGVAAISIRRRTAPTTTDMLFLRYWNFALLILAPAIASLVYRVIGESSSSGLQRWF
jgi:hypothetical protein